ncbi:MAG: serine/threonine protein kinase [Myxococcales bacterium]|nr:serine/threonine protein kinase [Myxococcales bacterium]
MAQLAPGDVLADRFEVVGLPLGAGASGVVWPARDRHTGRDVAVKVLHAELVGDDAALSRLQDEARLVGRLEHANVVEVVGLWSDGDGRWMLVTERIDGPALRAVDAPMDPAAVIALGAELADALHLAHADGIVHGDVRPGNVLLGTDGARLFDFGVAEFHAAVGRSRAQPVAATDGGWLRPGLSAPEVLDGGPPGVPADLYGLGVVLYRALTGGEPFSGPSPWAVMGRQRQGPPVLQGPRGLVRLIRHLLQPDPTDRPPDASVVRAVLARLARNPARPVVARRFELYTVRPGRAWVVHGTDPRTGGPAVVRADLSRRAARRLVDRLTGEGWTVRADRQGLGLSDLLWVAFIGMVGAFLLPVLGVLPAVALGLWWRGGGMRPELTRALPPVSVPIPPRVVPSGTETALAAGFLLLATSVTMAVAPPVAVLPGGLLVALAAWSVARPRLDAASAVRQGRVAAAIAHVRAVLGRRSLGTDERLAFVGELDDLERSFHRGRIEADALLVRLDALEERLKESPTAATAAPAALEALRGPTD